MEDAYLSIRESLKHAGIEAGVKIDVQWIDAEELEHGSADLILRETDGILVPGGFGSRGTEGKMKAVQYAREMKVPYLGICFGMQLAVIEYARNVCGLDGASSTEFGATPHPVIALLPEQEKIRHMGATMRLGNYPAHLKEGSLAHRIYGTDEIVERHRHRYEVNPAYIAQIEEKGMIFSGTNGDLMEICEIAGASLLLRIAVPPGDEVPAGQAIAAVPGFCGSDEGENMSKVIIHLIFLSNTYTWWLR